jgi:carbon storage regulator
MLILKRKINESIVIDDDITLTIFEISRGCVKIGFKAPQEVSIDRKEIYDRKQRNEIQKSRQD